MDHPQQHGYFLIRPQKAQLLLFLLLESMQCSLVVC